MRTFEPFGMKKDAFRKIATSYILIQVTIWAKSALFFTWFGRGMLASWGNWSDYITDPQAYLAVITQSPSSLADFVFHQTAHVLIAVAVFTFAQQAKHIPMVPALKLAIVAAFLHNVGYWLTGVFETPALAGIDFAMDVVLLLAFAAAFRELIRHSAFARGMRLFGA